MAETVSNAALPRYRMYAIAGLCMLLYGFISYAFICSSAHITVTGRVTDVYRTYGRRNHFTHFQVVPTQGTPVSVKADYIGRQIAEGSTATAEFLQYNQRLLDLRMLSGPFASWHLQEDGGMNTAYFGIVGGVLFLGFSLWQFKTKGV